MNHKVSDASSALWQIYQEMDPYALEGHVTEVRTNTEIQFPLIVFRFEANTDLLHHLPTARW